MSRFFSNMLVVVYVLLALALIGGLVWANSAFVRSQPVEKNFLVPWMGARTFLQYGESPYAASASQRAQIVYYGRQAQAGQDPLTLWLPFPVELLYFPFALIHDYVLARAIWMTFMEMALAALAVVTLRLFDWKAPTAALPVVILFAIFWVYGMVSLLSGSGSAFMALAMAGFLLAFLRGQDELAGGLFLLTASVPSITGLVTFFFLWWVIFRRRWRVLGGAAMVLAFLLALSFLFLPNWFLPFLRGAFTHMVHVTALSSVRIFASWSPVVGLRLGWAIAALFLLLLSVEWGAAMQDEPRHVLWTVCLTMTVMPLMGVRITLADYVFLFIPLMLLMGILAGLRSTTQKWGLSTFLLIGLFLLLWGLAAWLALSDQQAALSQTLFLFLPVLLLPWLYWVRWRFTRRPAPELSMTK